MKMIEGGYHKESLYSLGNIIRWEPLNLEVHLGFQESVLVFKFQLDQLGILSSCDLLQHIPKGTSSQKKLEKWDLYELFV